MSVGENTFVISKNAVLEPKYQKCKGWTAAKVMDVIARLPDCVGQAADAISAYTQEKLEDAVRLLKIPKSECPDIWIRLPRHKGQHRRPTGSFCKKCGRPSTCGTLTGEASRRSLFLYFFYQYT